MLSVEEAKKILDDKNISDTEIAKILDALYKAARLALDKLEKDGEAGEEIKS